MRLGAPSHGAAPVRTLPLAEPVGRGVCRQLRPAAKVMGSSGDELGCASTARIEVKRHGLVRSVHGHDHASSTGRTLEHELLRLALELMVVSPAKRLASQLPHSQPCRPPRGLIQRRWRSFHSGASRAVSAHGSPKVLPRPSDPPTRCHSTRTGTPHMPKSRHRWGLGWFLSRKAACRAMPRPVHGMVYEVEQVAFPV